MQTSAMSVIHNTTLCRFELRTESHLALLEYSHLGGQRVSFDHTEVPDALRGRGVGVKLVEAALDEARKQGWKVEPRCSFVAHYLQKHPGAAS